MTYTISTSVLKILYKLLEYHRQDADTIFASAGLSRTDLSNDRKRVNYQKAWQLWSEASHIIEDPCFGLKTANIFHPSDLNLLGYAWLSSPTLRAAFERLLRYQKMVSEFINLAIEETEEQFNVILDVQDISRVTMAQMDSGITILFHMCQSNFGHNLRPSAVYLAHPKPPCQQAYNDYFQCPVLFEQPVNKLCLPAEVVDTPLLNVLSNINLITDKTLLDYLDSMYKENTTSRVRQAISRLLPSEVSIEKVSQLLHLTPRTLHRHLQAENTSFKTILDDLRFRLSKEYLQKNQYSITEIAFQLGFSDSSAFSRAFRQWSGESPSQFKKQFRFSSL